MAKYLDQSGLQYLWTKIMAKFAYKDHNHDEAYVHKFTGFTSAMTGHVVTWGADGKTIQDGGYIIQQNVLSTQHLLSSEEWSKVSGVTASAATWNSDHAKLEASASTWNTTTDKMEASAATWSTTTDEVDASATTWNSTADKVTASGASWNSAYNQVTASGASWNSAYNQVTASGASWNTAVDKLNASGASWNSVVDNAVTAVTVNGKSIVNSSHAAKIVVGSGVTGTTNGTIIANLKDYTANTSAAATKSATGTLFPVELDKNGKLAVMTPNATVTGVKSGEKVIGLDGTELTSTLKLNINKPTTGEDSGKTFLQILGINDSSVTSIDVSEFVVDGMLNSVELSGSTLIFKWNTDSGIQETDVDLASFIDDYSAGSGITIDGNGRRVNVKLSSTKGNVTLKFGSDSGLTANVDSLSAYTLSSTTTSIQGTLTAHTSDTNVHIQTGERTKWNAIAASGITGATINGTNVTVTGNHRLDITAVTKVSTGVGLTGGDITTSGTVKTNLVEETQNTAAATRSTSTDGGLYAVEVDKNGALAVRVPWTDTHDPHAQHGLNVTNGTASQVNAGTEITYVESVSGCTPTSGNLTATTTRKKVTIPVVNDGKITFKTSGTALTEVADFTANQSANESLTFIAGTDIIITPDPTNQTITVTADISAMTYGSPTADIDEAIYNAEHPTT